MPSTPFTTAELDRSAPCLRDLLPPDPVHPHSLLPTPLRGYACALSTTELAPA